MRGGFCCGGCFWLGTGGRGGAALDGEEGGAEAEEADEVEGVGVHGGCVSQRLLGEVSGDAGMRVARLIAQTPESETNRRNSCPISTVPKIQ